MKKLIYLSVFVLAVVLAACSSSDEPKNLGGMNSHHVLEFGELDLNTLNRFTTESFVCTPGNYANYQKMNSETVWEDYPEYMVGGPIPAPPTFYVQDGKYIEPFSIDYPLFGPVPYYNRAIVAINYRSGREVQTFIERPISFDAAARRLNFGYRATSIVGASGTNLKLGVETTFLRGANLAEGTTMCLANYTLTDAHVFTDDQKVFKTREEAYDWVIAEFEKVTGGYFDSRTMHYPTYDYIVSTADIIAERDGTTRE